MIGPSDSDARVREANERARMMVTALLSGQEDLEIQLLIADHDPRITLSAAIAHIVGLCGKLAEAHGVPPLEVWQTVCEAFS